MTDEKLAELKELLGTKTIKDLAIHFGMEESALRWQIRKHGLKAPVPWARPWKEVKSISLHASRYGITSASEHFGITRDIVKNVSRRYRDNRLKYVRGLIPEELNLKRKQAVGFAWKNGHANIAEDFGSYVMIKMLSTGSCNFKFLLPNFLKETFGNYNSAPGKLKMQATSNGVDIDDPAVIQLKAETGYDTQSEFEDIFKASGIAQNLRMVFLLSYMWEFDALELAFLLDEAVDEVHSQIAMIEEDLMEYLEKTK